MFIQSSITHKLFLLSVSASPFLHFFFQSGVIAYGPAFFFASLVLSFSIFNKLTLSYKDWGAIFIWLPYVLIAGMAYVSHPYEGQYISSYMVTILILPIVLLCCLHLKKEQSSLQNDTFFTRLLFAYLLGQLIICMGQISNYLTGVGFHIPGEYFTRNFIPGTYFNPNDLGAAVVIVAFLFSMKEKNQAKYKRIIFWIVTFALILLSASRSAMIMLLIIYFLTRQFTIHPKKIISLLTIVTLATIFIIFLYKYADIGFINRTFSRITSLRDVFENGIDSNSSMSARSSSYLFFMQHNLASIGMGTWDIKNYYTYSNGATFEFQQLLFRSPHSLVVEIGYWLGWPGLISFFTGCAYLLRYTQRPLILIVTLGLASSIPSSVIGSPIFISIFIMSFFSLKGNEKDPVYQYNHQHHDNHSLGEND